MFRRSMTVATVAVGAVLVPTAAMACGGLVAPNGAVNLARTTTLAAYVDGVEHYITAFEFTGLGGAKFGSIVPLPGEPTKVERAGDWTLQRLLREVASPPVIPVSASFDAVGSAPAAATVILRTKIDALDITVVKGGAVGAAEWARAEGFDLSPDAPEVLAFYATRSPYFLAASFDAERARALDQTAGDSTPIHVTIPIERPWVPLRILALGRQPGEPVNADLFLLTEAAPAMLPAPRGAGDAAGRPVARDIVLERSERARTVLLRDLRSDRGMRWLPKRGLWLTYLRVNAKASTLGYDLAIDPSGRGNVSWRDAGFPPGVFGPARNPIGERQVRVVRKEIEVPVVVPVAHVDRTGWVASALLLLTAAGIAQARRRLLR